MTTQMHIDLQSDLHNQQTVIDQIELTHKFQELKAQYDAILPDTLLEPSSLLLLRKLLQAGLAFIRHAGVSQVVLESIVHYNLLEEVVELWHTGIPVLPQDEHDVDSGTLHTELSCCTWGELLSFPAVPRGVSSDEFQERAKFLCCAGSISCQTRLCVEMFEAEVADHAFESRHITVAERSAIERNAMDIWIRAIPEMYEREDHVLVLLDTDRRPALGHAREFHDSDEMLDEDEDEDSNIDMLVSQDLNEVWDEVMGEDMEHVEFVTTHEETEGVRQQRIMAELGFEPVLYRIASEMNCFDLVIQLWDEPMPYVYRDPENAQLVIAHGERRHGPITVGDVFTWPHVQIIMIPNDSDNETQTGRYNIRLQTQRVRQLRYNAMLMLARASSPPFLAASGTQSGSAMPMITEAQFADVSLESNRTWYAKCHELLMMALMQAYSP